MEDVQAVWWEVEEEVGFGAVVALGAQEVGEVVGAARRESNAALGLGGGVVDGDEKSLRRFAP